MLMIVVCHFDTSSIFYSQHGKDNLERIYRARHPCPAPTVASRCPPADCSPATLLAESDTAGRACLVARPGVTVSEKLPAANRPAGQAVDSGGYGTGSAAGSFARMPARLGLSQGSHGAYRHVLQTVSFLCGLRSTHQAGALLRDVPVADVALSPSVDCLPALPCRCQSPGLTVLGVRHHVCRRTVSRLHGCLVRLAASAARRIPTRRRRWRGLLVSVVETWRATPLLLSDNYSIQILASWGGLSTPAAAGGQRCKPSWRPRHTASCSPGTRHRP